MVELGSAAYTYQVAEGWGKLPDGWSYKEAAAVGVDPNDNSEADMAIYQRMRPTQQRIGRNHIRVDTTADVSGVVRKIAKDISRWNRA